MDLSAVRQALSKRRDALFSKRVGFLAIAGLALVVGLLMRAGLYLDEPGADKTAPAVVEESKAPATPPASETAKSAPAPETPAPQPAAAPDKPAGQTGGATEQAARTPQAVPDDQTKQTGQQAATPEPAVEPTEQAGQPDSENSGVILVAKRPVEVRSSPSDSAPVAYGFPAGRPFRVIGREGNFAHIQDLTSKASGWIDEAALAPPPARPAPSSAGRSSPQISTGSRPSAVGNDNQITTSEPSQTYPVEQRRRGGILFGRGGLFGGLFGN
jgi:Bacterial SH3 domain